MSLHRWNAKRDANEPGIVEALRAAGALVMHLSGTGQPDLLVCFRGHLYVLEVKRAKTKGQAAGRATKAQDARSEDWPVSVVQSDQDALRAIGALPAPLHICQQPGFDARVHQCLGCRCEGDGVPLHGSQEGGSHR